MRRLLTIALIVCAGAAAQIPAGARDAADTSRQDAANAKLRAAESALEHGDYALAAATLKTLASEKPKDARIQYDLGFAEERSGAETEAAAAYAAALAADQGFVEARLALALLDARAGRTEKARAALAAVARQEVTAAELRARALRAMAQIDEAASPAQASDELVEAIKLTRETESDIALSAALAARSGDRAGAEAAYRRTLKLNPDDADAATGLARMLEKDGRAAEAEGVLTGPLKAHPADPRLVSEMASLLATEGKATEAIPLLQRLRSEPKFAGDIALTRQLARLYAVAGRNTEAEATYKAALATNRRDPGLLDDLGSVLVHEQKYAEAQAVLTEAVGMRELFTSPDAFGEAAGHLAFAASKNGQPRITLQALKLRATVQANSGPSLFLEATAYDTLREYKEAIRSYRAFLAIAAGKFPDQEFQARHRLVALEHMK